MIRLIKRADRRDIDLGYGVTVTARPVTTWIHRAAQHSAERMVRELAYEGGLIEAAGGSIRDIPDLHQREGMLGLRDQLMLQALARHAIIEWQGVAGEDGEPLPVTPEAIDVLMRDHPAIAATFEVEYLRELTAMYSEGNGSGASPSGTSGAGYCGRCAELGEPCAEGGRGRDGKFCPYNEHAPQTIEGEIAWGLLAAGQWQRGGMDGRLAGLDIAACLARPAARGADPDVLEYLLAVGEAASLTAANREQSNT